MRCLVGIDDTDSSKGGCTTHLAYRIARDLNSVLTVLPYPRLVRLNPNVPFKTRGNAAVSLLIETASPDRAFEAICAEVTRLADTGGGANSGVVFCLGESAPEHFSALYARALRGIVNPRSVRGLLRESDVLAFSLGNGMGIVGAASALAFDERFDHTYELIAYRRQENLATPRGVDSSTVKAMELSTWPHTFNSYDHQKRKALVSPHGPDPVFLGIRGDSPESVMRAFGMVAFTEALDGHMLYVTNQHTDAHLDSELREWKAFSSGWIQGRVVAPRTGAGGHVYFSLVIGGRSRACAAYEPTGDLRRAAAMLSDGDLVRAYGGVRRPSSRHPSVLNVEKLAVVSLARGGGARRLRRGTYIASPRANRHLTRPLARYGSDAAGLPSREVEGWLRGYAIETRAPV